MRRLPVLALLTFAAAVVACADLPTGPGGEGVGGRPVGTLAFAPAFAFQGVPGAPVVRFQRVRVVLRRGTTVVLDEVREFPGGVNEATFTYDVPLLPGTPSTGETFTLTLELLAADGTVLFRGEQPVTIVPATPGSTTPPPPISVPVRYAGPGANAVRVVLAPSEVTLAPGGTQQFTATAQDASGAALPGTPIGFTATSGVTVTPTGLVTAGSARATATVTAVLLTGPTATATVRVVPPPANLAKQGGDGQTAPVGTALGQPIVVRVTAADGVGSAGVSVSFTTTAGTLGAAAGVTGADGTASTTLTLPTVPGPVTVTATAAGLAGSPQTFTATAVPGPVDRLVIIAAPSGGEAGVALGPLTVEARDRFGNRAVNATGELVVTASGGPGALSGPTTQPLAQGQATFAGLVLGRAGSYTLTVRLGETLTASTPVTIAQGPATQLVVTSPPSPNPAPTTAGVSFTVAAQDVGGDVVTGYLGIATVTVLSGPGPVSGTTSLGFVGGFAEFAGLRFSVPGSYTLRITTGALSTTTSLTITAPPPVTFSIVSGNGQTGAPGDSLPVALRVRLLGPGGVPAVGRPIVWTNVTSGGSFGAPPPQTVTDAGGYAEGTYKLGPTPGPYVVTVTTPDAPGVTLTFVNTAVATASAVTWNGSVSSDWHTAANWTPAVVPTSAIDVTIPSTTVPNVPIIAGGTAAARNLTVQALLELGMTAHLSVHGDLTVQFESGIAGPGGVTAVASGNVSAGAVRRARANLARRAAADGEMRPVPRRGRLTPPMPPIGTQPFISMMGTGTVNVDETSYISVSLDIRGSVTTLSPLDLPGLWITSNGLFDNNGFTLNAYRLVTLDNGRLQSKMVNYIVVDEALFYGGSTAGLLDEGHLSVYSRFEQGGHAQSFAPAGSFSVYLYGGAQVEFTSPGLPGTGSYFHQVSIGSAATPVTFNGGSVYVADGDGAGGGESRLTMNAGDIVDGPAALYVYSKLDGYGTIDTDELDLMGTGNQLPTFFGVIAANFTVFSGSGISILPHGPVWNTYIHIGATKTVHYTADVTTNVNGYFDVEGALRITGSGTLDVTGNVNIGGPSASFGQVAGSVLRAGGVHFNGASTTGLLPAGTIEIRPGGFLHASNVYSTSAFAPSGTHLVRFLGVGVHTITFAGAPGAFNSLEIASGATVIVTGTSSPVPVNTTFTLAGGLFNVNNPASVRVLGTFNRPSGTLSNGGNFCFNTSGTTGATIIGNPLVTPCP